MAIILVTDARLGSAVAVIRSLAAMGHRVVAVDSDTGAAGLRSRATWRRHVLPAGGTEPEKYAAGIRTLVERLGIDIVIPITDESILPLMAASEPLGAIVGAASPAALEAAHDKSRTIDLAREVGVPVPDTVRVANRADAIAAGEELGWPVVLKPRRSRVIGQDGRSHALEVTYANTSAELGARADAALPLGDLIVQRYHPGDGVGVELLMHEGRPLAAFQHRRLREVPVTGGASAYRESVALDGALLDHAVRLLRAMAWTGLAMVEFKVSGSEAHLLEVNGRIWGSLPLAVKSGMDFPGRYVELLLSGPPAGEGIATAYRVGVRSRNLRLELVWIASVLRGERRYPYLPAPSRRDGLAALAGLAIPSSEHDVLSLADPVPGLVDAVAAIQHVLFKALGTRG